jgi:ABC-2 type transport system ATP-binding protein
MIRLENVCKQYGSAWAVKNLNLTVPKGELFGFIGPNGAGKTTTIRVMAGLIAPTEGTVFIDGVPLAQAPERAKKKIGLIPDRPYLYEKLTGMEFLEFTADLYGVPPDQLQQRAATYLDLFSLTERADELIEAYSHGMKQRLIMAAALLHEPPLIIVDEPMVGLDPRGIKMVRELFQRLTRNGTTIFMSTHTLALAEKVCNRIGIINKGHLIATGTMDDLKLSSGVVDTDLEKVFFQLTQEADPR